MPGFERDEIGTFVRTPRPIKLFDENAFGPDAAEMAAQGFKLCDMLAPPQGYRGDDIGRQIAEVLEELGITCRTVFMGHEGEAYDSLAAAKTNGLVPAVTRSARKAEFSDIVRLTRHIGAKNVGIHVGRVLPPMVAEMAGVYRELAQECADASLGLAFETSPTSPVVMRLLLQQVNHDSVLFNLDTANTILYQEGDPVGLLRQVLQAIPAERVLVHAKDAKINFDAANPWFGAVETAIGQGEVDFLTVAKILAEAGNFAPWVIEREPSSAEKPNQIAEICAGRDYLAKIFAQEI